MPMRRVARATSGSAREKESSGSKPAITASTAPASPAVPVKTVMQSSVRQAGTRPRLLQRPFEGFNPTRWLKAAGMRPEPAVSVPSANATSPAATATAEPELDPPLIQARLYALRGMP